jgi:hypothetical protein
MYSSSGEPGIQDQMSRSSDRIETGAEWTADMNPSTAQHLTYLMYYAASFGFDKAGVAVTADQWQEIKSPAIEISYPDEGGYHFKATLPPSARDFHFNSVSAQFDEAGVPIQIDTEYTKGGETFTRSLELREEGDYSETITNVDDPESAIVRTVAKAEPLPEAESIDAPENTEPESKAFKLVSFVKDRFIPRYQIRTFIPTRHEQVAQPEDVQDDTPSINP